MITYKNGHVYGFALRGSGNALRGKFSPKVWKTPVKFHCYINIYFTKTRGKFMNCDIVNMKYKTTKTLNLFILKNSAFSAIEKPDTFSGVRFE